MPERIFRPTGVRGVYIYAASRVFIHRISLIAFTLISSHTLFLLVLIFYLSFNCYRYNRRYVHHTVNLLLYIYIPPTKTRLRLKLMLESRNRFARSRLSRVYTKTNHMDVEQSQRYIVYVTHVKYLRIRLACVVGEIGQQIVPVMQLHQSRFSRVVHIGCNQICCCNQKRARTTLFCLIQKAPLTLCGSHNFFFFFRNGSS